jgi:hypothetical protein
MNDDDRDESAVDDVIEELAHIGNLVDRINRGPNLELAEQLCAAARKQIVAFVETDTRNCNKLIEHEQAARRLVGKAKSLVPKRRYAYPEGRTPVF